LACSYQFTSGEHTLELYYDSGTTEAIFGSSKNLVGFYIFHDVVSCYGQPFRYKNGYNGARTSELEHLYLWLGFTGFTSVDDYSYFIGATPKLTAIEGDCPLISLDRRMLIFENKLVGFAPSGLTSYTFPDTITTIYSVFSYKYRTFVGDDTNTGGIPCSTSISSFVLPSNLVEFFGDMSYMTSLEAINLPNTVTAATPSGYHKQTLQDRFVGCTNLKSAYIPTGINSLQGTFSGCTSLSSVTIARTSQFEDIGDNCFSGCLSLSSITLPDLTAIGGDAFFNCTALSSVTFGTVYNDGNENAIDNYAFGNCTNLQHIYFTGTGITTTGQGYAAINYTAFSGVRSGGTFHYKYNSNPGGIMSNSQFYLGFYGWTAVNDIY